MCTNIETGSMIEVRGSLSTDEPQAEETQSKVGLQQMLQEGGETITVEGNKVTREGSSVHTAESSFASAADEGSILSTARMKNSSIPLNNHAEMMKDPDNVVVSAQGIDMSLSAAIKHGLVSVNGDGNLADGLTPEELNTPEPMTPEQIENVTPVQPMTGAGAKIHQIMTKSLGAATTSQAMASLISVWSNTEGYADTEAVLEAAGEKLAPYYPTNTPDERSNIARVLLQGFSDAIGRNISMVDPNIEADAMLDFIATMRPEALGSVLLGMVNGSYASVKELVDRYHLKNRGL
jgi:hypothetical protein